MMSISWGISVDNIKIGCLVCSLAKLTYVAALDAEGILDDRVWDGDVYLRDNGGGDFGRIVFRKTRLRDLIGGVFSHESARNPYAHSSRGALWTPMATIMPPDVRDAVVEYLFPVMTFPSLGSYPGITSLFWTEYGQLSSNESIDDFRAHGGFVFEPEMMQFEGALERMKQNFRLSALQTYALRQTVERRISTPKERPIILSPTDIEMLVSAEPGPVLPRPWRPGRPLPSHGIATLRRELRRHNIVVPE